MAKRQAATCGMSGLGVGIEQAGMRHVDPERQQFAEAGRAVRVEAADNLPLADLQHRMGLGAGRLDHFDRRGQHRKPGLLRLQARIIAKQVLRPHAQHNLAVRGPDAGVCGSGSVAVSPLAKRNRDRRAAVELRRVRRG